MSKAKHVVINIVSGLIMLALIPLVPNDYNLSLIYAVIIVLTLSLRREKDDFIVFFFGLFVMTGFEYIFVKTGVETFQRNTLFGVLPLWLPLLWGYGFIAVKRTINVLDR